MYKRYKRNLRILKLKLKLIDIWDKVLKFILYVSGIIDVTFLIMHYTREMQIKSRGNYEEMLRMGFEIGLRYQWVTYEAWRQGMDLIDPIIKGKRG